MAKKKKKKSANKKPSLKKEMAFVPRTGARSGFAKRLAIKNPAVYSEVNDKSRNDPIDRELAPKIIIADQNILSRENKVDQIGGGSAGNRSSSAPPSGQKIQNRAETLVLTHGSDHPGPTADLLYQKDSVLSLNCPYCSSADFVKRGTRMKKGGRTQLYLCRACKRTFTPVWFKGRQHSWQVILDAISYYNLGFSLEQTGKVMKQKFGVEIMASTLSAWLAKYGQLCAYKRMRPFAVKMYSPYEVVETCTLAHRQLYRFRYHRAKTKFILADDFKHYKFTPLKEFLDNVTAETPHQYFQEGERMSESLLRFSKTEMIVRAKHNYATALAGLVFQGVSDNKQRHEALQKFFLANDSVTVATEVPVYLRREDLEHMRTQLGFQLFKKAETKKSQIPISNNQKNPKSKILNENAENKTDYELLPDDEIPKLITGHIDFLQIRNGAIHILDYKGEGAASQRPIEQLTLYALALSRLTGLRLFHFKCAWFDQNDYFEFFPLHVVYKRGSGRKRIKTIEGVYNLNEKINKIENLRPAV